MSFPLGPVRAEWSADGRVGCELEATEEEFGTGSISDARLDVSVQGDATPDPEESILPRRFTDRTTQWSALGDLRVERSGRRLFRSHGLLQIGRSRSRGELELQTDGPVKWGRLAAGGRFLFQAGPEGSGAGRSLTLRSTWTSPVRVAGWEARVTAAGERSWAGADSLAGLFDYTRLLPSVEFRRGLGGSGDLSARMGLARKHAPDSESGDFRERWAEGEWSWFSFRGAEAALRLRSEARAYPTSGAGLPSYEEFSAEGETEIPLSRHGWRVRLAPSFTRVAYASDDSLVFRDHWSGELLLRVERSFRRDDDRLEPAAPGATVHAGVRHVLLRNERARDADYRATSFLLGCGREATARWWLDFSGETGRRDYRRSGAGGSLVYEGYNLTVSGTDFTFVSGSLLAQAALGRMLRLELFGLYDRELHHEAADDFALWSWSAALTRTF